MGALFKKWIVAGLSLSLVLASPAPVTSFAAEAPAQSKGALVPIGKVKTHSVTGSGQSDLTSRYSEYVGSERQGIRVLRPSQLERALGWSQAKAAELQHFLRDFKAGRANLDAHGIKINDKLSYEQYIEKLRSSPPSKPAELTYTILAFYIALGFVAAYVLWSDHSHDPMAWDKFVDTLTDPVGALALIGFLAGSYYFFKRMGGFNAKGKFLRALPLFTAGLLAGTLVSTAVTKVAGNADVQACLGFSHYRESGYVEFPIARNTKACDAAIDTFIRNPNFRDAVEETAYVLTPMAAEIVVGGSFFLGSVWLARFFLSRKWIANILSKIPFRPLATGRGGLPGFAVSVLYILGFIVVYSGVGKYLSISKRVSETMLAWRNPITDANGNSIRAAEKIMLEEWAKMKNPGKSDWNTPAELVKKYDGPDSYGEAFISPWINPNSPSGEFTGALKNYHNLMKNWRTLQLQDAYEAYQNWLSKMNEFQTNLDGSYHFYKRALELATDPVDLVGFSYQGLGVQDHLPTLTNSIWYDFMRKNYDGHWKHVSTPTRNDYFLTSMACGPEVENYTGSGPLESLRQAWKSWVNGNTAPRLALDKNEAQFKLSFSEGPTIRMGGNAIFNPPRITNPLAGTRDTICESPGTMVGGIGPQIPLITQPIRFSPSKLLIIDDNHQKHQGLVSYIYKNIRESVVENGENYFEDWWRLHITDPSLELAKEFEVEYDKMIDELFKPAVQRKDSYWCEKSPIKGTGLENVISDIATQTAGECALNSLHKLSYGQLQSIKDEVRLYLAMQKDLFDKTIDEVAEYQTVNDNRTFGRIDPDILKQWTLYNAYTALKNLDEVLAVIENGNRLSAQAAYVEKFNAFAKSLTDAQLFVGRYYASLSAKAPVDYSGSLNFAPRWNNELVEVTNSAANHASYLVNIMAADLLRRSQK